MRLSRFAFGVFALSLIAAPLRSQTATDDKRSIADSPKATLSPRPTPSLVHNEKSERGSSQPYIYFIVLVALAGAGLYLIKRGLPLRAKKIGESRLQILETKMLGNRQFLVVVQYDDSKMLLGVGPGQIQLLCPLDSAEEEFAALTAKTNPVMGTEPR
jgi:flagellar protein FliO/FliZ